MGEPVAARSDPKPQFVVFDALDAGPENADLVEHPALDRRADEDEVAELEKGAEEFWWRLGSRWVPRAHGFHALRAPDLSCRIVENPCEVGIRDGGCGICFERLGHRLQVVGLPGVLAR